jgi:AcrR family transcriptional regulator
MRLSPTDAVRQDPDLPDASAGSESAAEVDGRRLRRQRNRVAAVDALLDLYREGNLRPSSAEVAERAGLSPRSLFRYFDDVDDLCRAAIARQERRAAPLLSVPVEPDAPLGDRVRALAEQRVTLFETIAPAATVARLEAPFQPVLAAELERTRAFHRSQLIQVAEPELGAMSPRHRQTTLAALDVLCSFESYQLLRQAQGLDQAETARVLGVALTALLTSGASSRNDGR